MASLHTTLLDSRQDVHFLFKSSPFGTQSHGHNPNNSFQLNAYAGPLLTTCVYRDLHRSKFHYDWAHSTVAHNALLVDGQVQTKHTPAPHGRILDSNFTSEFDYIAGDATEAYAGKLRRFHRHAVLIKKPMPLVVLFDDIAAVSPSTFQFMLHALQPFTIQAGRHQIATTHTNAAVEVTYLSPVPLVFRQWDGFQPPPDRQFPNQWHVQASTKDKRTELGLLTLLVPQRVAAPVSLSAQRVDWDSALGVRIQLSDRTRLAAFRKPTASKSAALDSMTFAAPFSLGAGLRKTQN